MADSHEHHPDSNSVWDQVSAEDRHALIADDSQAWRGVTGLLLTIVIGGVLLGILGATIATLTT